MRLAGELSLIREVWALAWPAMTHMFLVTLVFLVNRAMVGRYSSTALASMQISGTLVWMAYAVFTAFSAGTLAVVARCVGAGDRATAARAARTSIVFAFALGLLVIVPILAANGSLLRALFPAADSAVIEDARAYLHIALPVLPIAFVEAIAAAALQGAGDTRTPLRVALAGNLVNVTLSSLLIFGYAGLPQLGVRGAAIGTAAAMAIEGALLAAALLSPRSPLPLRAPGKKPREQLPAIEDSGSSDRSEDWRAFRRVLRVSIPTFLERLVYHGGFLGYVSILGLLGAAAMAANQAMISIEAICWLSADGFGVAAAALVAQKLGAKRPAEASRAGIYATVMVVSLVSVFGLCFALAPRLLMQPFSTDPAIIALGSESLKIAAVAQPFMAFAMVVGMGLRGAGATRTVLYVTFVGGLCVRIAATWLFAITLGWGLAGIWLGSTADWVVRSVLLAVAYKKGRWKTIAV